MLRIACNYHESQLYGDLPNLLKHTNIELTKMY